MSGLVSTVEGYIREESGVDGGAVRGRARLRVAGWLNATAAQSAQQAQDNALRASDLAQLFPELLKAVSVPCECPIRSALLYAMIIHLNDNHADENYYGLTPWTREQIAQWVEEVL